MQHRREQAFGVGPGELWRALRAALPRVVTKASFWEHDRRVEWSTDMTGFSWTLEMQAAVETAPDGTSLLVVTGHSSMPSGSLSDPMMRKGMFDTLVDGITEALADPSPVVSDEPTEDWVRWWNGREWSITPPTPAGWNPDPAGRHQLRYWDGAAWTGWVSDDGQETTDRLP